MKDTEYLIIPVPDEDEEISLPELLSAGAPAWYAGDGRWADGDAVREYYEKELPTRLGLYPEEFILWAELSPEEIDTLGRTLAPHICGSDPTGAISAEDMADFLIEE